MERSEAEAIYDQGREVVVAVLLRMDEQIHRLEERVTRQDERIAQLERRLNRNSGNSSAERARARRFAARRWHSRCRWPWRYSAARRP